MVVGQCYWEMPLQIATQAKGGSFQKKRQSL